ncbi:ABC transporter substrate-binding protein [Aquipuribacter nitratireducens]|uniref:ABC transporter substrate-binding protein n=1 Tax=Aquipuribacter nitratireducens TaxID=650104 RepID=A0ABW0GLU3_9MICO
MPRPLPSRTVRAAALLGATALVLAACADDTADEPAATGAPATMDAATDAATDTATDTATDAATDAAAGGAIEGCDPASLETLTEGTLTMATSEPAFEPWMVENDPTNEQGYESAVAYAVAERLGYADDAVEWVRVPFEAAIAPGPKDFDVAINQFSITEERRQAVDFSSPYYDVRQAVVTTAGSPADGATTTGELGEVLIGAQVGTTSLQAIEELIGPTMQPQVFNSNEDAVTALQNGQVDAIVVDLPTAFFVTAVQLDDGVIVGQLPELGEDPEQFGMVLDLGSPLTDCVSRAVDALEADGTLDALQEEWLADVAGAPELG